MGVAFSTITAVPAVAVAAAVGGAVAGGRGWPRSRVAIAATALATVPDSSRPDSGVDRLAGAAFPRTAIGPTSAGAGGLSPGALHSHRPGLAH